MRVQTHNQRALTFISLDWAKNWIRNNMINRQDAMTYYSDEKRAEFKAALDSSFKSFGFNFIVHHSPNIYAIAYAKVLKKHFFDKKVWEIPTISEVDSMYRKICSRGFLLFYEFPAISYGFQVHI